MRWLHSIGGTLGAGTDCVSVDCLRRAERRLGEIMAEQPRQGLGEQWEKKPGIENPVPSLAEQGIDKNVKLDLCAELMCLLTSLASATA